MSYVLFLIFNAMVFVLPAELIEGLQPICLYQLAILGWLLTTCPLMFSQLSIASRLRCPITLCAIGLFVTIVLTRLRFRGRSCWGWSRSCFLGLCFFPASTSFPPTDHRADCGLPVPSDVEGRGGGTTAAVKFFDAHATEPCQCYRPRGPESWLTIHGTMGGLDE